MEDRYRDILTNVLAAVTPRKEERERIEALARSLETKVASSSKALDFEVDVRLEGSVAKDTWLSGEPDIDIFMRVPPNVPRRSLGDTCLKVARSATEGSEQTERFAEHPYLEATVEGTLVNIVPCYKVKQSEWQSATDRTPFHTDYVKEHLKGQKRGEARLLKKFLKGIDAYGAEIRVGGLSGYLCELLILQHGSFLNTLKEFAQHRSRTLVDVENHYIGREDEARLLFEEPLVAVDPVDESRNVASSVQPQRLDTLVASAREFLKRPHMSFFFPPETVALTETELTNKMQDLGSAIVFLTFGGVNAVPDVLWGQLYKSHRSLRRMFELNDFVLLRSASWSDEKALSVMIFELEQQIIAPLKKHLGPPLEKREECESFLRKHINSPNTVSGPQIEGARWTTEIRRKDVDAAAMLTQRLLNGGRGIGVARRVSTSIRDGYQVLVNAEILPIYRSNSSFAGFLTEFLSGKPHWLKG